ncbi:glycosyltransferase [Desulfallas thermosapovorans]|uniref:Glycosyltransferase involved in cell wall biosynthesis n=1 Tax=Desulfallas thermosapovorans DSM 6562 TaxID=1121431 RepID=A0A5S4ZU72_9FIRM|nr:glycosyltransferase [Desulfallas thermosapovorans]TYO96449.1 glycosyltransferase involved in cell wall biosynthesis [Desulfallas thermosapovorans DSM 6562]
MSCLHSCHDVRVSVKQAASLAKKYDVELHAIGDFKFARKNGVKLFGLPKSKRLYTRPLNWCRLLVRALRARAGLYHFHDPELIPVGLVLRLLGRKVIYDVHEDYPDAILHKTWIPGWARKLVSRVFNFVEKKSASFFNAVVLAESGYQESFKNVKTTKVEILNYPLYKANTMERPVEVHGRVNLIYAGNISAIRGAVEMVEALHILRSAAVNAHLYLVGPVNQPGLQVKLNELARTYGLQDHITMTGLVSHDQVYQYYRYAHIGLGLLYPVDNFLKSLATKIFEYMAVGLPMVVSDFPGWKKLLGEVKAGVTANPLDPKEIAVQIKYLVDNPQIRADMAMAGRKAFEERFNWLTEEKKLLGLYEKLLG